MNSGDRPYAGVPVLMSLPDLNPAPSASAVPEPAGNDVAPLKVVSETGSVRVPSLMLGQLKAIFLLVVVVAAIGFYFSSKGKKGGDGSDLGQPPNLFMTEGDDDSHGDPLLKQETAGATAKKETVGDSNFGRPVQQDELVDPSKLNGNGTKQNGGLSPAVDNGSQVFGNPAVERYQRARSNTRTFDSPAPGVARRKADSTGDSLAPSTNWRNTNQDQRGTQQLDLSQYTGDRAPRRESKTWKNIGRRGSQWQNKSQSGSRASDANSPSMSDFNRRKDGRTFDLRPNRENANGRAGGGGAPSRATSRERSNTSRGGTSRQRAFNGNQSQIGDPRGNSRFDENSGNSRWGTSGGSRGNPGLGTSGDRTHNGDGRLDSSGRSSWDRPSSGGSGFRTSQRIDFQGTNNSSSRQRYERVGSGVY